MSVPFNPHQERRALAPLRPLKRLKWIRYTALWLDMNGHSEDGTYYGKCGWCVYRIDYPDGTHAHCYVKSPEALRCNLKRLYPLALLVDGVGYMCGDPKCRYFLRIMGEKPFDPFWDHKVKCPIVWDMPRRKQSSEP